MRKRSFPTDLKPLRLSTWNCCRGKPEVKLPRLLRLKPDLVALQECARPVTLNGGAHLWHGDNPRQGLLTYTNSRLQITPLPRRRIWARHYFPAKVTGEAEFSLLNIWVKPYRRPTHYMQSLLRGIAAYADLIRSGPTVILGDFNSTAYFGPKHHDLVALLHDNYGLVSAYHEYFGLGHGDERHPTYYDRTQHGRPYHLDYCFIPQTWLPRLKRVLVGPAAPWTTFSDHVPLTVELET